MVFPQLQIHLAKVVTSWCSGNCQSPIDDQSKIHIPALVCTENVRSSTREEEVSWVFRDRSSPGMLGSSLVTSCQKDIVSCSVMSRERAEKEEYTVPHKLLSVPPCRSSPSTWVLHTMSEPLSLPSTHPPASLPLWLLYPSVLPWTPVGLPPWNSLSEHPVLFLPNPYHKL